MKRERGFSGIEIIGILAAAALAIGAIGGVLYGFTSYVDGVRKDAVQAGSDKTKSEYESRDNAALAASHKEIVRLLVANQQLQSRLTAANTKIAAQLQREKEDGKNAQNVITARIDSGDLRLRDGIVIVGPCAPVDGAGRAAGGRTAAGGTLAAACAKFSPEAQRFLLGLANEADDAVRERNATVARYEAVREIVNAWIGKLAQQGAPAPGGPAALNSPAVPGSGPAPGAKPAALNPAAPAPFPSPGDVVRRLFNRTP